MIKESALRLYEAAFLLALDDQTGTPAMGAQYLPAVTGGILAELVLLGRIRIEKVKRNTLVQVIDSRLTGDALLDECFQHIRTSKRPQMPSTWLKRFATTRDLRYRVTERLWLSGLLRKEQRSVLWVFTRTVYPAHDARPKARLREILRTALLGDDPLDERIRLTLAVVRHTLLARLLDRRERKARRRRIDALTKDDPVAKAIRDAIAASRAH